MNEKSLSFSEGRNVRVARRTRISPLLKLFFIIPTSRFRFRQMSKKGKAAPKSDSKISKDRWYIDAGRNLFWQKQGTEDPQSFENLGEISKMGAFQKNVGNDLLNLVTFFLVSGEEKTCLWSFCSFFAAGGHSALGRHKTFKDYLGEFGE